MEGGVEHGDLRHGRECFPRGTDADQVRRIVQRRERRQFVDLFLDCVGDEGRLGEDRPAVHDPVADGGNIVAGSEGVESELHAGDVVDRLGPRLTDSFDEAVHEGGAGFDIHQLVFDG